MLELVEEVELVDVDLELDDEVDEMLELVELVEVVAD